MGYLILIFQFLDNKFLAVSTDNGAVKLYRVIGENEAPNIHLEKVTAWDTLHSFGYVCRFIVFYKFQFSHWVQL